MKELKKLTLSHIENGNSGWKKALCGSNLRPKQWRCEKNWIGLFSVFLQFKAGSFYFFLIIFLPTSIRDPVCNSKKDIIWILNSQIRWCNCFDLALWQQQIYNRFLLFPQRVYDQDVTKANDAAPEASEEPKGREERLQEQMPQIRTAISLGLTICERAESQEVPQGYASRRLPHLIGSKEFWEDESLGFYSGEKGKRWEATRLKCVF